MKKTGRVEALELVKAHKWQDIYFQMFVTYRIRMIRMVLVVMIGTCLAGLSNGVMGMPSDPGIYAQFHSGNNQWICQLDYQRTPRLVANFIGLAEGTRTWFDSHNWEFSKKRLYDGTEVYRVIKGFMLQGGSPNNRTSGTPGFYIRDEFHPDLRLENPGMLAMANSGPNTLGSQFFITLAPTPWLNNINPVFGKVIEGMDQIISLAEVPVDADDRPLSPWIIDRIDILRIGTEAESFSATSLEDPLPELQGFQKVKIQDTQPTLRITWEAGPTDFRDTLFWTGDFKNWTIRPLGNQPNVNLLLNLGNNTAAVMQDIFPTNFFVILRADAD